MTPGDNVLAIAISEARDVITRASPAPATVEDRLRLACGPCRNHWMVTDRPAQLRAAVAATVLETADPVQKERLVRSYRALARVSHMLDAMMNGVPVDWSRIPEKQDEDLVPILKIWKEAP